MGRISRIAACLVVIGLLTLAACVPRGELGNLPPSAGSDATTKTAGGEGVATIYLAGGCFWGLEKYMSLVPGVVDAQAGYANGAVESPTYEDVSSGTSGHAETVKVVYDPAVAPLPFLLRLFYKAIDPTSLNRQGNDIGTQYRSGIYFDDPADRTVIERSLAQLQARVSDPVVVEAEPLKNFTPAEEYHQDYLEKNPGGYCHIGIDLFREAADAKPQATDFAEAAE